jgi:hypothetical protein
MKMIYTNREIQEAAEAMVRSREFCGDEYGAVKQYADDIGKPFPKTQYGKIKHIANKIWNGYRKQAKNAAR